jgi:hypothetical protein
MAMPSTSSSATEATVMIMVVPTSCHQMLEVSTSP